MVGAIFCLHSSPLAAASPAAEDPFVSTADTLGSPRRISKPRRFHFRPFSTDILRDDARIFDRRIGRRRFRLGNRLLEDPLGNDLSIACRYWLHTANRYRTADFDLARHRLHLVQGHDRFSRGFFPHGGQFRRGIFTDRRGYVGPGQNHGNETLD